MTHSVLISEWQMQQGCPPPAHSFRLDSLRSPCLLPLLLSRLLASLAFWSFSILKDPNLQFNKLTRPLSVTPSNRFPKIDNNCPVVMPHYFQFFSSFEVEVFDETNVLFKDFKGIVG